MNKTKKRGFKRVFAWIDEYSHAELKAMAATKRIYLEELILEIIKEYLNRDHDQASDNQLGRKL